MLPLALVYFAEYFINQGLVSTTIVLWKLIRGYHKKNEAGVCEQCSK